MRTLSIISLSTALLLAGSSFTLAQTDPSGGDICPPAGTDMPVAEQLLAIQAADTAQVVTLDDCSLSPAAELVDALMANEAIVTVLEQETVGAGEILAVGVDDGAITIYVTADDA